tara:strand:+ start:353 stop:1645 length:1293 start_codon:yes stop_codon:yes gene_type:complete
MTKLLGSGSYGCVINKSITKKPYISNYVADVTHKEFILNEKKNKHISKIFANKEDYCEELVIITKILHTYHKIFNSITLFKELSTPPKRFSSYSLVNLNTNQYNEKKDIVLNKLKFFFNENHKKDIDIKKGSIANCLIDKFNFDYHINNVEIFEIVYNYDGIALDKIEINDTEFIKSFIILCKSLETFHQLKFVHRDIKPENILYNSENNKLSLIDFGLSIPSNVVYSDKEEWFIRSSYYISPPEFGIINTNKYGNIDNLRLLFKHNELFDSIIQEIIKDYDDFFDKYKNIDNINDIPENIKQDAYKGDIYSLGITLLILCIANNIKITHPDKELIKNKIFKIIKNMMKTNPLERYNLHNVVNDFLELQSNYISDTDKDTDVLTNISCDQDIETITKSLSNLNIKGGKNKIKKKPPKKIKKPIKKNYLHL